jgi:hypothetical protein
MTGSPNIALISATPAAIPPAAAAFASTIPEARLWNILDDRLLADATERGGVTPELADRMRRLIDHAVIGGADGILLTCSMYGFLARGAQVGVPVHAPDDAAFAEVIAGGYRHPLLVASLQGPLEDALRRFGEATRGRGAEIEVGGAVAPGAYDAALAGDQEALLAALEQACAGGRADAVLLAQYSLSTVAGRLAERLGVPVLSGPGSAARALRAQLLSAGAGATNEATTIR